MACQLGSFGMFESPCGGSYQNSDFLTVNLSWNFNGCPPSSQTSFSLLKRCDLLPGYLLESLSLSVSLSHIHIHTRSLITIPSFLNFKSVKWIICKSAFKWTRFFFRVRGNSAGFLIQLSLYALESNPLQSHTWTRHEIQPWTNWSRSSISALAVNSKPESR